ncbi:hypothetical protein B0T16DRAFT_58664 [Cercophora newfieldiana]|uniref:Uncharacterized protein n=1 Tax=Cercophora newfieldiana TaxID=92897 RepID=A0AA40CZM3_9PEZI|nr:hypothetical protein B0T16DRAFT_58664 [Cercophora newfieldiana]
MVNLCPRRTNQPAPFRHLFCTDLDIMNHIQVFLTSHRRLETRGGQICQVFKVFACGCMIGTAFLFPLANATVEALWFRCATLSIFIITTLAFHAIHVEPFVRFGPFTAPVALFILLLAVLPPGSPRAELIPWLPLFIAASSLSTVAIHESYMRFEDPSPRLSLEDGPSDISIGTWSYRSTQIGALSNQHSGHAQGDLAAIDALLHLQGPPFHYAQQRHDSDISLSDGSGRIPSDWDSETRSFWPDRNTQPNYHERSQASVYQQGNGHDEMDTDHTSEGESTRSVDLLLGPQ